jgi:signal transduction histidine kinase
MSLSLRTRILLGAVLWTGGLVLISFVVIAAVFRHSPNLPFLGVQSSIHYIWGTHAFLIVVTAAMAMLGGAIHVRRGLAGIAQLRKRLAAVHSGQESRLTGEYVREVQPLVNDLNALIEQREQAVRRAVAKAGDLAHGLKTPLALLALEAERASAAGQDEVAAALREQVGRMRRQIDYHLAHARAAASGSGLGARASVSESADGLARTLPRLYADRHLSIDVRVDPSHVVRVQREDLDEMLGNLLDNACKWARSRVVIESTPAGDTRAGVESGVSRILITVDDDGPGLALEMREKVMQRGVRADEKAAGSGLGLAIVRDLAEVYGATVTLNDSPLGGLRARLALPRAD